MPTPSLWNVSLSARPTASIVGPKTTPQPYNPHPQIRTKQASRGVLTFILGAAGGNSGALRINRTGPKEIYPTPRLGRGHEMSHGFGSISGNHHMYTHIVALVRREHTH